MLAHERIGIFEGAREHRDVRRGADVASTTAAVRFSPRSFARFIGEPLKAAENSSCVMPSSSRASVRASIPASPSRAARGDSPGSAFAKRWFPGHTSWDVDPLTHFEIPLTTGMRTARPASA